MTLYVFNNNAESLLASAVGATDTTLSVTTGDGAEFPSPAAGEGFFALIFYGADSEWVLCTGRSSDTLTVTRGQLSTTARAWPAGATVSLQLNSTVLDSFIQKEDHRTVSASPNGSLAARWTGEEVLDTTNGIWYKHTSGTPWKAMNA